MSRILCLRYAQCQYPSFLAALRYIELQKRNYVWAELSILRQRFQLSEPLCTALYTVPGSIDFATRVAKALARKTGIPAYIGCSVEFSGATVEEEVDAVRVALEGLMSLSELKESATTEKDSGRLKIGDSEIS